MSNVSNSHLSSLNLRRLKHIEYRIVYKKCDINEMKIAGKLVKIKEKCSL